MKFAMHHTATPRISALGVRAGDADRTPATALPIALWLTIGASAGVFLLAEWGTSSYYTAWRMGFIIAVHFAVLFLPILGAVQRYRKRRDFLHPSFAGATTFAVFYVLLNPIVLTNADVLNSRGVYIGTASFWTVVIKSYVVVLVAWIAYLVGEYCAGRLSWLKFGARRLELALPRTELFLVVGAVYVAIGVFGNMLVMGGVSSYIAKMFRFYERPDAWEQASVWGGTKLVIMMKFLPVGLLILAVGWWLYSARSRWALTALLGGVVVANVFLSCATGGRGTTLQVLFYAVPVANHLGPRLKAGRLMWLTAAILGFAFVLGIVRAGSYFGTLTTSSFVESVADRTRIGDFLAKYLTNSLGTITLVNEVETAGPVYGATLFAGWKGLLGGATPLTTQAEVWWRVRGEELTVNPRYGPPGELLFNYGWPGVVIGMIGIGLIVGVLSAAYDRYGTDKTLFGAMVTAFTVYTAHFVVMGNCSYFPSHFTYYSLPFYLVFVLFRQKNC